MKARALTMLGGKEMHRGLWWWKLEERGCLKDRDIEMRILLKWILKKLDGKV